MPSCGFLGEEAVKASCWAVAWDQRVRAAAVPRVVFGLGMATLTAYSTPFIGGGVVGAGICVVGE